MPVDFILAGTQKAGTTAFHAGLSRHRSIFMSARKELHFFDREAPEFWKSPDYRAYERHFADASSRQLWGEATPNYMYWPCSIERIAAYNAGIKLVVILRNPIERAHSAWSMERRVGRENLPFAEAIRSGRSRVSTDRKAHLGHHRNFSYVERGFYADQLDRILQHFPRGQLLVLIYEKMLADLAGSVSELGAFLGVEPIDPAPFRRSVQPSPLGEWKRAPLEPGDADRRYLAGIFRNDVGRLEKIIGEDLAHWGIA